MIYFFKVHNYLVLSVIWLLKFITKKEFPFFSNTASSLVTPMNFTPGLNSSNRLKVVTSPLELINDTNPSSFPEVIIPTSLNLYKLISLAASSALFAISVAPLKELSPAKGSFSGSGSSSLISDEIFFL